MKIKYKGATNIAINEAREEYLVVLAIINQTIKNDRAM